MSPIARHGTSEELGGEKEVRMFTSNSAQDSQADAQGHATESHFDTEWSRFVKKDLAIRTYPPDP